ncbi:amidase [Burkholderia alba]|uniref:amidase n=1 Tax=Burkholderia alba TaxID=2683677 RepID=UPI002B058C2D|nr:amidase [Burkholderia alba]
MRRRQFLTSFGALTVASSSVRALASAARPLPDRASELLPVPDPADASGSVRHYLARIETIDRGGPRLRSFIVSNPEAASIASALDAERAAGGTRGPLHGVTVALKDNIATGDGMATTAGSLALDGVRATRDAYLVGRLRRAGAVVLGKTNLSEWANFRSTRSTSGWSGVGGLSRNPYALDRSTSGSSSGSAAAVAANLTAMAVGTETDGSIVSPASINGVVGLKPTVGRISRDGIVPISATQDTAGPIARTVAEAALLLSVLAGRDANDPATLRAPAPADYVAALDPDALRGARIGIARAYFTGHDEVDAQIERAIAVMAKRGAVVIDPVDLGKVDYQAAEAAVLLHEFKHGLPLWLNAFAPHAPVHSVADVIAFNEAQREREMPYFGQELLVQAQAVGGLDSAAYRNALNACRRRARDEGLARVLRRHRLDALVAPTGGTAWLIDLVNGDSSGDGFSTPAAVAGYPHLTVPAGLVRGLPVGVSFVGAPWSEARLLALGYAFEQATQWRGEPRFVERSNIPPLGTAA